MADGILCKHCGWQETEHTYKDDQVGAKKRKKGYKKTLWSCKAFAGETESEETEMTEDELRYIEHKGNARYAWGVYQAHCRLQKVKSTIKDFDDKISDARSEDERRVAESEKKKFVDECRSSNQMFVGG